VRALMVRHELSGSCTSHPIRSARANSHTYYVQTASLAGMGWCDSPNRLKNYVPRFNQTYWPGIGASCDATGLVSGQPRPLSPFKKRWKSASAKRSATTSV
jgi:hypothetical protein